MHKVHAKWSVILLLVLFALLTQTTCQMPGSTSPGSSSTKGSITITLKGSVSNSKNIGPGVDLTIASYDLSGDGPSSASFSATNVTQTTYTASNLVPGTWTVTATGKNASGLAIVQGSQSVTVVAGQTASVTLNCVQISGNGTLTINLSWPSGVIITPAVQATLTPLGGSAQNLSFTVVAESASYTGSFANDYYTLTMQLQETSGSTTTLWGHVEAVLILAGQTTTGSWALSSSDLTYVTGGISVAIGSTPNPPITITLAGLTASLFKGSNMTVTATPSVTPTSWQWYLNSVAISGATSASQTVGASLTAGPYWLDVVAYGGSAAGSTGSEFLVHGLGQWGAFASMSTGRYGAVGVAFNGKFYVLGGDSVPAGTTATDSPTAEVDVYDPGTGSWTQAANMPTARGGAAGAVIGSNIYVVGGWYAPNYLNNNEVYDPSTNTWSTAAPMPTGHSALAAAVVNGLLYVFGGNGQTTDVEIYNPATNSWSPGTPLPTGLSNLAAAVLGNTIYLTGGYNGSTSVNTVLAYNTSNNSWTTKSPMSTARCAHWSAVYGGLIFVGGGVPDLSGSATLGSVECYDPIADQWSTLTSMSTARDYSAAATVGNSIYVAAGVLNPPSTGTALASTEKFNPLQ